MFLASDGQDVDGLARARARRRASSSSSATRSSRSTASAAPTSGSTTRSSAARSATACARSSRTSARSPGVIEWVNDAFDRCSSSSAGLQPANVPLEAVGVRAGPRPPAGRGRPRTRAPRPNADELREQEATRGRGGPPRRGRGRRALARPRPRPPASSRPPTWRDIAILLPRRTGLEAYEEALAAARHPLPPRGQPRLLPAPGGPRPGLPPARDRRPARPGQRGRRAALGRVRLLRRRPRDPPRRPAGMLGLPRRSSRARRERVHGGVRDSCASCTARAAG